MPGFLGFDPTNSFHRGVMQRRIAAGFDPQPGPRWKIVTMNREVVTTTYLGAPTGQEALLTVLAEGFEPIGPTFALLDEMITQEDCDRWRQVRDAWIAQHKEER